MDTTLFFFIFGFSREWAAVDLVGIFFAEYAIVFLALISFVSMVLIARRAILSLFFSVALAYTINAVVGFLFFRDRPFVALGLEPLISVNSADKSFPSDHTAVAFALAGAVGLIRPTWAPYGIALAFLIGLSRIFVGVHYPADVFMGMVVGIVSAVTAYTLFVKSRIHHG